VSDFFAGGDRTMTAQVPIGRIPTMYAKTGDLFAWLCIGGLIAVRSGVAIAESTVDANRYRRKHWICSAFDAQAAGIVVATTTML
jgi:hypothetical protein